MDEPAEEVNPGATTGHYPEGRLTPYDEGELPLQIGRYQGRVVINFGKPVQWLGMNVEKVRQIALEICQQAMILESEEKVLARAFVYLSGVNERAEPYFLSGLKSARLGVRLKSIDGLSTLKSEAALEPVAELMSKDDSTNVLAAAAGLLRSHGAKAEPAFVTALESEREDVRRLAIGGLRDIKSEKSLARIAEIFREDESKMVHKEAFDYLKSLGIKAEKELIEALSDEDKEIRRGAIETLGREQSEASIPKLLEFVGGLDKTMKQPALDALGRIGPKAIEATVAEVKAGRMTQRTADSVLALYYREEVERILDRLVTEDGGTGSYAGQFQELKEFGVDKARPVLLEIARDAGYTFRASEGRKRSGNYVQVMRENAVSALGAMGDVAAVEPLKEILAGLPNRPGTSWAFELHDELAVALYRLGEKKPFDAFAEMVIKNAETALKDGRTAEGCNELFSLALIRNRVGRRAESRETYLRVLKAAKGVKSPAPLNVLSTTYYNLACLDALEGKKAGAIEWLEKSVRAGFIDRAWIRRDGDLNAIRGEPGYLKLLSEEDLFKERIPK